MFLFCFLLPIQLLEHFFIYMLCRPQCKAWIRIKLGSIWLHLGKTNGAHQTHKCAPRFVRGRVGAKECGGHGVKFFQTLPESLPVSQSRIQTLGRSNGVLLGSLLRCPSSPVLLLHTTICMIETRGSSSPSAFLLTLSSSFSPSML